MNQLRKDQISQEVFQLYDDYAHNRIDRREFIDRLSAYAVGGVTLASLMSAVMPDYVSKIQVPQDDPRLTIQTITYESPKGGGKINAQLCRPENASGKLPATVVVHENRGLNPQIAAVGRRAALAGFVALAADALTRLRGSPGSDDDGRALPSKRDRTEMLEDSIAGFEYLRKHEWCTGSAGV